MVAPHTARREGPGLPTPWTSRAAWKRRGATRWERRGAASGTGRGGAPVVRWEGEGRRWLDTKGRVGGVGLVARYEGEGEGRRWARDDWLE